MNRTKYIRACLAAFLALCLIFGLAACGKEKEEETPPVYASPEDVTAASLVRNNSWSALLTLNESAGIIRSVRAEDSGAEETLELHTARIEGGWEVNQYSVAADGTAVMFYRNTADELKASYVVAPGESYLYLYSEETYAKLAAGGVLYCPQGADIAVLGAEATEEGPFLVHAECRAENGDLLANSRYLVSPKTGLVLSAEHRASEGGSVFLYTDEVSVPDNWQMNADPKKQITEADELDLCEVEITVAGQTQTLKLRAGTRILYDSGYVGAAAEGASYTIE